LGKYLSDSQIQKAQRELSLLYSLPYAIDLVGTTWEQILSDLKGGTWTHKRDNRARPDLVVEENGKPTNYSVKTESLRTTDERVRAEDFLGTHEDLIVARPKVDEYFGDKDSIDKLKPDKLGGMVIRYYNEMIVRKFEWHVLSILLRVDTREFIYWEERPPVRYKPEDYWWLDSGRATGTNRNINGYPKSVKKTVKPLPRAKFKWTSGGKQFYILYEIPQDADCWKIDPAPLSRDEILEALHKKLLQKKRSLGLPPAT